MGVVFECMSCGAHIGAEQLAMTPEIKCPNCVPYFENIIASIDGQPYVGPIGLILEEELRYSDDKIEDRRFTVAVPKRAIKVISFDPESFKVVFAQVSKVIKRVGDGAILKVTMADGRNIFVSSDHPVIVLNGNGIHVKSAKDLDCQEDFVLAAKSVPAFDELCKELDLIEEFKKIGQTQSIVVKGAKHLLYTDTKSALARKLGLNGSYHIQNWRNSGRVPLWAYLKLESDSSKRSELQLGVKRVKKGWIPAILSLDYSLAGIIGYYLSEGVNSEGSAEISFSFNPNEKAHINELCESLTKVFGLKPVVKTRVDNSKKLNSTMVSVYSLILCRVFNRIFKLGSNSYTKDIPSIFFATNNNFLASLLETYFIGDAFAGYGDGTLVVKATTASEHLMTKIPLLLLRLGIGFTIRKRKSANTWDIEIQRGSSLKKFIKNCGRILDEKELSYDVRKPQPTSEKYPTFLVDLGHAESRYGYLQQSKIVTLQVLERLENCFTPLLKKLVNGGLHPLKIRAIEFLPYSGHLYDFEVYDPSAPYENFMHGHGVFTHNCGYRVLKKVRSPVVKSIKGR